MRSLGRSRRASEAVTGRPTALDEALMFEICDRIADGETVRQIAASDHMPVASTIYLELARNSSFSEQYARARAAQLERWEDEIVEIADDGTNDWMASNREDDAGYRANGEHIQRSRLRVDARKWLMAKRLPKKYGDRVEHEVNQTVREITDEPITPSQWAAQHVTEH